MNCSRFRFLIQQWFDQPLSSQDERMLMQHLETCDSCHRFQHQLDQVIQSTAEVPLPDECLPSNLESLAKRIMIEIPQDKPGFMSMLKGLFPFLSGGTTKQIKPKKEKPVADAAAAANFDQQAVSSNFPHVRRPKGMQDGVQSLPTTKGKRGAPPSADEDQLATSTRLKSLQRLQPMDNDPNQAMSGASLGTKFGMGAPLHSAAGNEPMTLAESIRRKVSDDAEQKSRDSDWSQLASSPENYNFAEQPADSSFGGIPQTNSLSSGVQPGFGAAGGIPSMGQNAPGQWGAQYSGEVPTQQQGSAPAWGENADSSWDPQAAQGGAPWIPSAQPAAPASGPGQQNSNAPWGAPSAPAPISNEGWGAPPAPAPISNEGWGAPPAPAPVSNEGWGAPPAPTPISNEGWGAPPAPTPVSNEGWGAPPAPMPVSNDGWGAPPVPAPVSNDGWGAPPAPTPVSNDGWGAPPAPTPVSNEGWGAPPVPAPVSNEGWGAPPAPMPVSNEGWGAAADAQTGWEQQGQPLLNTNPHLTAAPAPESPVAFGQQAQAMPVPGAFDAWSEEGEQIQTGMWQAFTLDEPALGAPKSNNAARPTVNLSRDEQPASEASRWDTPIQQRIEVAPTTPANESADRWDVPISERNQQQQQPSPAPAVPLSPPVPPVPVTPQSPMAPSAPAAVPPTPRVDASRWETPIQQQQAPPPAPAAQQQSGGLPKNGIMDRLNTILGEDLTAMAGGSAQAGWNAAQPEPAAQGWSAPNMVPQMPAETEAQKPDLSKFDVPIQERVKQAAAAPAPQASAADQQSGLFKNIDDNAIDSMFSNLGVTEASIPALSGGAATPAPVRPGVAVPPMPPMPGAASPAAPSAPAPTAPPRPAPTSGLASAGFVNRPAAPPAVTPAASEPKISSVTPRPVPPAASSSPAPSSPAPLPAPPAAADNSGIFKQLDDNAMDKIFNTLGVKEQSVQPAAVAAPMPPPAPAVPVPPVPVMPPQPAPAPAGSPAGQAVPPVPRVTPVTPNAGAGGWNAAAQPTAAPPAGMPPKAVAPVSSAPSRRSGSGLFSVDDEAMDRIFNDLGVKEKSEDVPKINVREAVQQIRTIADAAPPTKVEGTGRLSREEQPPESTPGKIAAIGKFLLDAQDLQKIGRLTEQDLSDTKIRVLTHEASDEINKLLEHIATQPGVIGSVIVGHDGILIANSLPKELDPESIGILSLAIYVNTTNISKKMGHNHLHQLVSRTHLGYVVVADFGGGILVTVSSGQETEKLIPLMRSITQLVAQS